MNRIKILLIVLLGAGVLSCRIDRPGKTTIYIVRHAEKDTSNIKNPDPDLSVEGKERAKALAIKLKGIKIDAAFATKYKRTNQTASFAAKNSGVEIQIYEAHDFRSIAELVMKKYGKHKVLIVGHSNTVLELSEAFGVRRPVATLTEDDYDFFFEVTIDQNGKAELKVQHYGRVHHSTVLN